MVEEDQYKVCACVRKKRPLEIARWEEGSGTLIVFLWLFLKIWLK